jgi:hypothetical protein
VNAELSLDYHRHAVKRPKLGRKTVVSRTLEKHLSQTHLRQFPKANWPWRSRERGFSGISRDV